MLQKVECFTNVIIYLSHIHIFVLPPMCHRIIVFLALSEALFPFFHRNMEIIMSRIYALDYGNLNEELIS